MRQLAADLEIKDSLTTEVPGVYAFPLEEGLTVFISAIPHGFEFTCQVADCPQEEELFYQQALFANLYGKGTDGCVLGIDADGEKITLARSIDDTVSYKEFNEILEDFLNTVEFWKQEAEAFSKN